MVTEREQREHWAQQDATTSTIKLSSFVSAISALALLAGVSYGYGSLNSRVERTENDLREMRNSQERANSAISIIREDMVGIRSDMKTLLEFLRAREGVRARPFPPEGSNE